jgi:hypothetical protein
MIRLSGRDAARLTADRQHTRAVKTAPAPKVRERDVTKQIVDWLRCRGWLCLRLQSGVMRGQTGGTFVRLSPNGTPDWIITHPKWGTAFVEMKAPGKPLRPAQVLWHDREKAAGHRVIVADSFDSFLETYGRLIEPREQFTSSRRR